MDENAYNNELREKWEREVRENLERDAIHYANLRFDGTKKKKIDLNFHKTLF